MRKLTILFVFIVVTGSCSRDCENANSLCKEAPPNDEECGAYFQRWFYDKKRDSCKQIGYSGCNHYGFATKQECETCTCD
ncbi:MAG: hypothetical protein KF725_16625 [Cyclobacteriaceae bacterium]|nr:hypothetical protein [Cyclobacteriaceae bacterium]UYN87673.1 MAG: hypothetical protein KIT51_05275 [Cyclobacteriaceae bacterium]